MVVATEHLEKKGFNLPMISSPSSKRLKRTRFESSTQRNKYVDILTALTRHWNKSCKTLLVVSSGIIGSNDENQSFEVESGK